MIRSAFFFFIILTCINAYPQMKTGSPAAELSLPDVNGNIIHLSDLKGKVVMIDFWASWCGPCRKNNPHLVRLYKKYHEKGLEILGVSLDTEPANWKSAIESDHLEWLQVNDDKGWNATSTITYNVDAIPASFLIDKKGVIRKINPGERELESEIRSLIK